MTSPALVSRLPAIAGHGAGAEAWIAAGGVGVAAAGAVLGLGGAAASVPVLAIGGGAVFCAGLLILLAGGWVDGLVLLALALPLPALYSGDAARLSPAAAMTGVVVLGWMLRRGADRRPLDFGVLPRRPTLLFAGAVAVSAAFAQAMLPALRELVNLWLMLALLLVAADAGRSEPAGAGRVARAIALVAGIAGVLAVLEAVGVLPGRFPRAGTPFNRAALGFEWPNELAMFFALALPFSVHARTAAARAGGRALATAGVVSCMLGLTATFSRGSWLAALTATGVLLLTGERRRTLRIWAVALLLVLAVDVATGGTIRSRIAATMTDQVVPQRLALQLTGLLMFQAHPVVGVGPGGFGEALDRFGPQVAWLWDYVGSAHNLYIHVAAEMGAVGLVALLVFLGAVFIALLRSARAAVRDPEMSTEATSLRRTALWAFATACLVGMVEWPFAHGIGQLVMLIAGLGCGLAARRTG